MEAVLPTPVRSDVLPPVVTALPAVQAPTHTAPDFSSLLAAKMEQLESASQAGD